MPCVKSNDDKFIAILGSERAVGDNLVTNVETSSVELECSQSGFRHPVYTVSLISPET